MEKLIGHHNDNCVTPLWEEGRELGKRPRESFLPLLQSILEARALCGRILKRLELEFQLDASHVSNVRLGLA